MSAGSGLIIFPLIVMGIATMFNENVFTQDYLNWAILVIAVGSATVAGVGVLGSGLNSAVSYIIFATTSLGALWAVLTTVNLSLLQTIPYWSLLYTMLSVSYIVGIIAWVNK